MNGVSHEGTYQMAFAMQTGVDRLDLRTQLGECRATSA